MAVLGTIDALSKEGVHILSCLFLCRYIICNWRTDYPYHPTHTHTHCGREINTNKEKRNIHLLSILLALSVDVYIQSLKNTDGFQKMQQHLSVQPDLLPHMLALLLNMILYEESNNQWSLSRPFLALIIVYTDVSSHVHSSLLSLSLCVLCRNSRDSKAKWHPHWIWSDVHSWK